jgi:uncharacterized protein (DUF885 family)
MTIRLRRLAWIPPFALTALLISAAAPKPGKDSEALRKAADDYWKFLEMESVAIRVREGLPVDRMPDISLSHVEANAAFGKAVAARLRPLAASKLTHEETLTLAILRREADALVQAPDHYWLVFPVTPYVFRGFFLSQLFSSHPLQSKADADHYLSLLAQYSDFLGALQGRLVEQARRRIVLPKEEIPLTAGSFAGAAKDKEENQFWVKADRLAALTAEEREDFELRLAGTIATRVAPAAKLLIGYLQGAYASTAPDAVGLSQYPGGDAYYRFLVRRTTTLDVSPEVVHQTGLEGIARLNAELDDVRKKAGFAGTLAGFRQFLKTDARFYAKTPEEVGDRLMAMQNRILPEIPKFFGKTPKAPFGVQRLEPQLEGAVTFGYYQVPTAQDPRGYYKYNGSKLPERSLLFAGALISHELVPGHHFQLNLQRENESLPRFRRESTYTAYIEGWGEYASDLAGQMGMYDDPYDRAGRIAMDLFLTSRLVVDTGLNAFGWPRARAIAYMKENTLQSDAEIDTETLRYSCDIPSQALAYKMGMRKFVELREKARQALGTRFDMRKFHEAVLGSGPLPLDVLERHIDWFIAAETAR